MKNRIASAFAGEHAIDFDERGGKRFDAELEIGIGRALFADMAYTADAGHEDHRDGCDRSDAHRVVAGSARHVDAALAGRAGCSSYRFAHAGIHRCRGTAFERVDAGARISTEKMTRRGMTFAEPGSTVSRPTVTTDGSARRDAASSPRITSAAALSGSERAAIGTVPACPLEPSIVTRKRRCPAIAVTMPSRAPVRSRIGPCSTCSSKYPATPAEPRCGRPGSNPPSARA